MNILIFSFQIVDENRIKHFNGHSISKLNNLRSVMLYGNKCISENCFSCSIPSLITRLNQKCGFIQPLKQDKERNAEVEKLKAEYQAKMAAKDELINKTFKEIFDGISSLTRELESQSEKINSCSVLNSQKEVEEHDEDNLFDDYF